MSMRLLWLILLFSCTSPSQPKPGDVVRMGNDSFRVEVQHHVVVATERIKPVSVHDEINPKFRVHLDNSQTFPSTRQYPVGDTITYLYYVRLK